MSNILDEQQLDALYERYGFTKNKGNPIIRVYTTRRPIHFAEIVPLHESADTTSVHIGYQSSGYATRVVRFSTLEEAHDHLFMTYFAPEDGRARVINEHKRFVDEQSRLLGAEYQYIPPEYRKTADGSAQQGILETILDSLRRSGPQLVLVEAAAGFGKTCTAYELSRSILEHLPGTVPILTELSRSRQARIFRYVLFDEIERSYPGLTYELVSSEIQSGRLPLIIDGFDELLSKASLMPNTTGSFDEVETMLDTISALLQGEAKIILNTRKTAVFAGDEFFQWVESKASAFELTRITLLPPTIQAWIGPERTAKLTEYGSPLTSLANPVILAFLRNLPEDKFEGVATDEEKAISEYFRRLLEREQTRQKLFIPFERQRQLFTDLAFRMAEWDITSETRNFITELILSYNKDYLEEIRKAYPAAERPSAEDLARTLAGHALLDRVGRKEDTVGFVNDFVAGILFGDAFIIFSKTDWIPPDYYASASVTAYAARGFQHRQQLLRRLHFYLDVARPQEQLAIELQLRRGIARSYKEATFESVNFEETILKEGTRFTSCIFSNCVFDKISFSLATFANCGFIGCQFLDCQIDDDASSPSESTNWFRGCLYRGLEVEKLLAGTPAVDRQPELVDETTELEIKVLEQFWPPGRAQAQPHRLVRTLLLGVEKSRYVAVNRAIDSLRRQGLIRVDGSMSELCLDRMAEIRRRLGR